MYCPISQCSRKAFFNPASFVLIVLAVSKSGAEIKAVSSSEIVLGTGAGMLSDGGVVRFMPGLTRCKLRS